MLLNKALWATAFNRIMLKGYRIKEKELFRIYKTLKYVKYFETFFDEFIQNLSNATLKQIYW